MRWDMLVTRIHQEHDHRRAQVMVRFCGGGDGLSDAADPWQSTCSPGGCAVHRGRVDSPPVMRSCLSLSSSRLQGSGVQFPGDDLRWCVSCVRLGGMGLSGQDQELMMPVILPCRSRGLEMDKPFLMPIEDVFTITGRGTW